RIYHTHSFLHVLRKRFLSCNLRKTYLLFSHWMRFVSISTTVADPGKIPICRSHLRMSLADGIVSDSDSSLTDGKPTLDTRKTMIRCSTGQRTGHRGRLIGKGNGSQHFHIFKGSPSNKRNKC